jgi:hypothetical protein
MYGLMQVSMMWRHCEGEAMLSRRALPFSMTAVVSSFIWKRQFRVDIVVAAWSPTSRGGPPTHSMLGSPLSLGSDCPPSGGGVPPRMVALRDSPRGFLPVGHPWSNSLRRFLNPRLWPQGMAY